MHYEGNIYRPPSEGNSLIIQVTVGCSHNKCTFCTMFKAKKFRMKPSDIILADLLEARSYYRHVPRIFLVDGDVLCMSTDKIIRILEDVRHVFPECERVGVYGRASQILGKSDDELVALRELGLGIIYVGAESGSDEVLRRVCKGESARHIIEAIQKAEKIGIKTTVLFISGLGGREYMAEHAAKTGEMISAMKASCVSLLTLLVDSQAPIYTDIQSGVFEMLTPLEVVEELETILMHSNCVSETVFRSTHASNWLALEGTLPYDKSRLLEQVRYAKTNTEILRSEGQRRF